MMSPEGKFAAFDDAELRTLYEALLQASTSRDGSRHEEAFELACDCRMEIGDRQPLPIESE